MGSAFAIAIAAVETERQRCKYSLTGRNVVRKLGAERSGEVVSVWTGAIGIEKVLNRAQLPPIRSSAPSPSVRSVPVQVHDQIGSDRSDRARPGRLLPGLESKREAS